MKKIDLSHITIVDEDGVDLNLDRSGLAKLKHEHIRMDYMLLKGSFQYKDHLYRELGRMYDMDRNSIRFIINEYESKE